MAGGLKFVMKPFCKPSEWFELHGIDVRSICAPHAADKGVILNSLSYRIRYKDQQNDRPSTLEPGEESSEYLAMSHNAHSKNILRILVDFRSGALEPGLFEVLFVILADLVAALSPTEIRALRTDFASALPASPYRDGVLDLFDGHLALRELSK